MTPLKSLFTGASVTVLVMLAILMSPRLVQAAPSTLDNMQAAFNGESNAHVRYLAFAQRAEAEGYGQVASLFRAAARAEEIHASNHAEVIKKMGSVPQSKIDTPDVKSTRENLQAAIKGETYERDVMYPDFLRKAKLDRNRDAVKSLNLARTAEAEHAKLYSEALSTLEQLKGSKNEAFYVCPTCGFTARTLPQKECPSCFTPKDKFEKVA